MRLLHRGYEWLRQLGERLWAWTLREEIARHRTHAGSRADCPVPPDIPLRRRIYVAGAYSADNVLGVFENMRRGFRVAATLQAAGYAPLAPWADCLLFFQAPLTLQSAYETSASWLTVADAVLVIPEGATASTGVQRELELAKYLEIPVFYEPTLEGSIAALQAYFGDARAGT